MFASSLLIHLPSPFHQYTWQNKPDKALVPKWGTVNPIQCRRICGFKMQDLQILKKFIVYWLWQASHHPVQIYPFLSQVSVTAVIAVLWVSQHTYLNRIAWNVDFTVYLKMPRTDLFFLLCNSSLYLAFRNGHIDFMGDFAKGKSTWIWKNYRK